jgi:hypothetical protein
MYCSFVLGHEDREFYIPGVKLLTASTSLFWSNAQ